MKNASTSILRLRFIATGLAAVATTFLSGCSLVTTAPQANSFAHAVGISGVVHGGQQPLYNAVVNLYSAGTTGYGTGSTLLATATTDQNGNFAFAPGSSATGEDSGTTNAWSCLSTTSQIYLTAVGGGPYPGGGTFVNNPASALLAPLGQCSTISSSTSVVINELTTVAGVYALSPYINPGTSAGGESIGTSSTTQGTIGINNAVNTIANMVSITGPANGGIVTPAPTYAGTNASVSGVTVTATANTAKIITIANILAACINSSGPSSTSCADLFGAATPPPNAAVTSYGSTQSSGFTFSKAQDTMQAAYYMATNPSNAGSTYTCSPAATPATNLQCLFNISSSTSPFQTGLSIAPNDWTIGITYSSTSACPSPSTALFLSGPYDSAVDVNGNLWFINAAAPTGTAVAASFGEISPTGQPLFCGGAGSTAFTTGRGITIDPAGNVWASFGNSAKLEVVTAGATSQTSCATPIKPYGIVSDGNGNIFFSPGTSSNPVYVFPSGSANTSLCSGTATSDTEWLTTGYTPSDTTASPYVVADGLGRIWFGQPTTANQAVILYPQAASITAYSVTGAVVTFTAANTFAAGQTVTVTGLTTAEGLALDHQNYLITAVTSTTFSAATTAATIASTTDAGTAFAAVPAASGYTADTAFSLTGTAYGIAVDNNNYGYFGTTCCNTTSDELFNKVTAPATSSTAPTKSASGLFFAGSTGIRSIAVDGAANVWFGAFYPEVGTTFPGPTDIYGVGEFSTTGSGTTATFTALSPSGTSPGSNCNSAGTPPQCPVGGGFQDPNFLASYGIAIDPSGNVWVPNGGGSVAASSTATTTTTEYYGTSITELIGAGVPVVTPTALGLQNGTQGTKP